MVLVCNPATPTFFSSYFPIFFLYYCSMKKLLLLLLCVPLIGFGQTQGPQDYSTYVIILLVIFLILILIKGNIFSNQLGSIRDKLDKDNRHFEDLSRSINDLVQELDRQNEYRESKEKELKEKEFAKEIKKKEEEKKKKKKDEEERRAKLSPEDRAAEDQSELDKRKSEWKDFFDNTDDLFEEAAALVILHNQGSTSYIQRRMNLGYNRAGRIIDQLSTAGILGPFEGSKPRKVFPRNAEELLSIYAETIKLAYKSKVISKETANISWSRFKDLYESKGWMYEWGKSEKIID